MSHLTAAAPRLGGSSGLRLCHADALALLEIIDGCVRCKAEEEFRRLFWKLQGLFPFEHACAVLGGRGDRCGVIVEHFLNVSCGERFVREAGADAPQPHRKPVSASTVGPPRVRTMSKPAGGNREK